MELKDKKTKITYHNGLRSIGGTIVEIAYEQSRIFFDFGCEYNPAAPIQPTDLQSILDLNLAPFISGVYDPAIQLKGYQETQHGFQHEAVFVSHVHLDHTKMINYINPSIPLYAMEGTKSLLETLNINNDFLFTSNHLKEGQNTRDIIGVKEYEVVQVGDIQVEVIPIDHDAYGACGLRIQTPDTVIAYTGDIRFHGYREEATVTFCEKCKHCDVLIMEGVSVSFKEIDDDSVNPDELVCEHDVIHKLKDLLANNPHRQMTFNYYIANVERILEMMKSSSRTIVLSAYAAYVVKEASGIEPYYYTLDGDKDYGLSMNKRVDFSTLLEDEDKYLWQLDTKALEFMDDMKRGGLYIHSNAAPLGEYDPAYAPFMQRFADHDIEVVKVQCSGHAHPKDLQRLIRLIEPKLLTPLHSFHPERLHNEAGERLLPEKGQTI